MRDWLAQRLSAVVMVLYIAALLAYLASGAAPTYESWKALFAQGWMRVATLLFAISLAWHAWVGARDILMDYVKPDGLRLALEAATLLLLAVYLGWAAEILWR
jgi:succinate dehydrogenase / fumarate reductase membrane anchor subunit